MSNCKILISGAGAVGLEFSAGLIKSGADVDIFTRPRNADALRKNGITVTGLLGDHFIEPEKLSLLGDPKQLSSRDYQHIFICAKAFDTPAMMKILWQHISNDTKKNATFIMCHNGWGTQDDGLEVVGDKSRIFNGMNLTGSERLSDHCVRINVHGGDFLIGSVFGKGIGRLEGLPHFFRNSIVKVSFKDDAQKEVLAKLLYSCAMNPTSALIKLTFGNTGKNKHAQPVISDIIHEAFQAFEKEGLKTHWDSPESYLKDLHDKILPVLGNHKSTMDQDISEGRQTEIDYINGAIVKIADRHGLGVPVNRTMVQLVRAASNKVGETT